MKTHDVMVDPDDIQDKQLPTHTNFQGLGTKDYQAGQICSGQLHVPSCGVLVANSQFLPGPGRNGGRTVNNKH